MKINYEKIHPLEVDVIKRFLEEIQISLKFRNWKMVVLMSLPAQKCENFFKQNYTQGMLITFKMAYSCFFSLGRNLDFLDFPQKKFYNIYYWSIVPFEDRPSTGKCSFLKGPFPASFSLFLPFPETVNNFADDWIRTRVPWNWKRQPRCPLRHDTAQEKCSFLNVKNEQL